MWSLGCVTVVLLTGGSPFISPKTNQYCQKLAHECDLQQLDHVAEWQLVGKRPKDFVGRLLVLNEEMRLSAEDAKKHCWFSNDFHRLDFEEVYHRATKHWRPRTLKPPVIEMIKTEQLRELPMLQKSDLLGQRGNRRRSPVPIDPPYKPYPRRMSLSLLPKRRPGLSSVMSEEVRTAIREIWSPSSMRPQKSDPEDDEVPGSIPETEADELGRPGDGIGTQDAPEKSALHRPRPPFMSPFRPLVQKQSNIVQNRMPKADTASKDPAVKERVTKAVRRASCGSVPSPEPSTGKESPQSGHTDKALAVTGNPAAIEGTPASVKATITEERTPHGGGDVAIPDRMVIFHQRKDDMAAKKSSDPPMHGTGDQPREVTGEETLQVRNSRQKPFMSTHSSLGDSKLVAAVRPFAHAALETLERKNGPSKLRSPLQSLNTRPRRPSNMKRRRGSIYDIESDEESEQAQRGLSTLTLDPAATTFGPSTAWKKARTRIHEQSY